jgi:diguanylate cyclase (GGDEF)-like protein
MKPAVLFVDDDTFFLNSVKRTLHSYQTKWDMYFISDTKNALESLSKTGAAVIISDIMMPGTNGIEFLEIVQKAHPLASRIILSGNPTLETAVNALNRGRILKYLMKPCSTEDLIEAINEGLFTFKELSGLLRKVNRDGLTNIYNKNFIEQKLAEEIERERRYRHNLSILLLDIDHFKKVNDTYGHLAGDDVLVTVAKCLQKSVRATDYLGRYGGEEFLIIFTETELKTALKAAERFRENVSVLKFKDELIKVTISGGLKQYSGEDINQFLDKTDKLLYESKKNGRNKISK